MLRVHFYKLPSLSITSLINTFHGHFSWPTTHINFIEHLYETGLSESATYLRNVKEIFKRFYFVNFVIFFKKWITYLRKIKKTHPGLTQDSGCEKEKFVLSE